MTYKARISWACLVHLGTGVTRQMVNRTTQAKR